MIGKACTLLLGSIILTCAPAQGAEWANDREARKVACFRAPPTGSVLSTAKICRVQGRDLRVEARRADEGEFRGQLADRWEQGLDFRRASGKDRAIDVGRANWDRLPALRARPRRLPYTQLVNSVEAILKSGRCRLPGQSAKAFDIEVPVAVLVKPDGSADRVLVGESTCPALASLVGVTMLARADRGDYQPTGLRAPRWYASRLNFILTH
jgi:hypothetical protein